MSRSPLPSLRRLEARAQMALARAAAAVATGAINKAQGNNPGAIGPDMSPTPTDFEIAFTAKASGVLLVIASMTIGAQTAADAVSFHLSKDGVFVPLLAQVVGAAQTNGPGPWLPSGGFPASSTLMGFFTVTPGVAHTFGIQAVNLTAGNTTILSAGLASILIYELP